MASRACAHCGEFFDDEGHLVCPHCGTDREFTYAEEPPEAEFGAEEDDEEGAPAPQGCLLALLAALAVPLLLL